MQAQTSHPATIVPDSPDTFLPPIEKPKGLMMKLAYYFTAGNSAKCLRR